MHWLEKAMAPFLKKTLVRQLTRRHLLAEYEKLETEYTRSLWGSEHGYEPIGWKSHVALEKKEEAKRKLLEML